MNPHPFIGAKPLHRVELILSLFILLQTSGCFPGRRLLNMEVYHENQLVLNSTFDVPDSSGTKTIWKQTGTPPFATKPTKVKIQPDEKNPLSAHLTGAIHIKIYHVENLVTEARLNELYLVRKTPNSLLWFLSEEDIQKAIR